ncbi:MAG TPA: hypothetical protein PKW51_05965 [Methanoregulaceae archaeon]|nr:hypothetical protein [Methanoregulaceae archaeon]
MTENIMNWWSIVLQKSDVRGRFGSSRWGVMVEKEVSKSVEESGPVIYDGAGEKRIMT